MALIRLSKISKSRGENEREYIETVWSCREEKSRRIDKNFYGYERRKKKNERKKRTEEKRIDEMESDMIKTDVRNLDAVRLG